jgi:hypothetical protein
VYILLDANVTAGYYLPRSLRSTQARNRIEMIFDSVRSGATKHFFYIPNFCVAEVFSVFMKHAFSSWNRHVKKTGTLDKRVYNSLVRQFQSDIHNGRFIYHYELSRYHVLGINLVAPIDHYYQYSRKNKNVAPMGTFDHLTISMGIHLAHIHGPDNVAIVSTDDRLCNILTRCKSQIPVTTLKKLKLQIAEEITGKAFGPALFPKHVNLKTSTIRQLVAAFGTWPLPVGTVPKVYRWVK